MWGWTELKLFSIVTNNINIFDNDRGWKKINKKKTWWTLDNLFINLRSRCVM